MINIYLLATVCFTVYFQLVLKWRVSMLGSLPPAWQDKIVFLLKSFLDPFIISAYAAGVLASLFWMATLTKLELSSAYPIFLSLSIFFIVGLSTFIFHETLSWYKCIGVIMIFSGTWFVHQMS